MVDERMTDWADRQKVGVYAGPAIAHPPIIEGYSVRLVRGGLVELRTTFEGGHVVHTERRERLAIGDDWLPWEEVR